MKYILRLLLCLSVAAAVLPSCVKEQVAGGGDIPEGVQVNINIASGTRIALEEDPHAWLDYQVTTLRIMGYHSQTGRLFFNRLVTTESDGSNDEGKGNANPEVVWTAEAEILTGDYTIVIIANEDIKQDFSDILQDEDQVGFFSLLEKVTLDYGWLEWDGRIPMLAVYDNVQVIDDNHINVAGKEIKGTWKVELERVAVRVDVTLNLTPAQGMAWEKYSTEVLNSDYLLYVDNVPERMYLFGNVSDAALVSTDYGASISSDGYNSVPGKIQSGDVTTPYKIEWPRLILPEYLLSQNDDAAKAVALRIGLVENGAQRMVSGKIGCDPTAPDYSLPRNHYIEVEASMKAPTEEVLEITLNVKPWDDGLDADVDINGPYTLTVEETDITLPWEGGTFTLGIETSYSTWNATLSTDATNANAGAPAWLSPTTWNGTSTDVAININYTENKVEQKTAYLHITAGRLTVVTKITQQYLNIVEYFAKSNIVMKPDQTLWFATTQEDNAIVPANAQGLMFKFGSLVGINSDAPATDTPFEDTHVVFKPDEYTAPATWIWSIIPYHTGYNQTDDEFATAYPTGTVGYDAAAAKGDICRYISAKGWVEGSWRMPTSAEMRQLYNDSNFKSGVTGTWAYQAVTNNSGWYGNGTLTTGWWVGSNSSTDMAAPVPGTIFLPAGGYRLTSNGLLDYQGIHGYYWSATASSATNGNNVSIANGSFGPSDSTTRTRGFTIRCIRDY